MPPAKPPISSLPSAIPYRPGDTLTREQKLRILGGGEAALQAFVQRFAFELPGQFPDSSTRGEVRDDAQKTA